MENRKLIKVINSKRKKKKTTSQMIKRVGNQKQFLDVIKAKHVNSKRLPKEKGFFGKKLKN